MTFVHVRTTCSCAKKRDEKTTTTSSGVCTMAAESTTDKGTGDEVTKQLLPDVIGQTS